MSSGSFLILNTIESRECLLSKLFFTPEEARSAGITAWHSQVRSVIKARRAVENETVPIMTVLKFQIKRALYLTELWINPASEMDPLENGWELSEGKFCPILQDPTDEYFIIPTEILKGCSCKKKCSESRRCSCYKSPHRGGCSAISCKNCSCNNVSLGLDHLHIFDVVMDDEDGDTQSEEEMDGMEVDGNESDTEEENIDLEEQQSDSDDWGSDTQDDDILPVNIAD